MNVPMFDPEMEEKVIELMSTIVGETVAKHLIAKQKELNTKIEVSKNHIVDRSLAIGGHRVVTGLIKLIVKEVEKNQ